jgi:hypothetical protein
MNRPCLALLANRTVLLLVLSGTFAIPLRAQVDSTASSTVTPVRRQNAWASGGIGVGMGGAAIVDSGWYSDNNLVVGVHAAQVAELWGSAEVHDAALMVGVRNLDRHGLIMFAVGPARLGGKMYVGDPYIPRTVASNEFGMAVSAEAIINFNLVGIGFDAFAARSSNRLVEGVTLSLQVGWFGN